MIAHPAAIALALFLRRLHANDPIRRSVIQIFAPASEHGAAGVEELQQQTVSLLSFKNLPKAIFDAQSSFNMLARYGEEAPVTLEETELRIERHLATLLALPGDGEGAPMPSLRLIQAPVFHGYSFSAWVEFEDNPGHRSDRELPRDGIDRSARRRSGTAHQCRAGGPERISVGAITPDRNSRGCLLVLDRRRQLPAGRGERGRGGAAVRMRPRSARLRPLFDGRCGYHVAGQGRPDAEDHQNHRHSGPGKRNHALEAAGAD